MPARPFGVTLHCMTNTIPATNWQPGDPIHSPVQSWKSFDFSELDFHERYKILIATIVPRPIAFVSTVSSSGVGNLAPFSFFNGVSSNPACVVLSISSKSDGSGEKKDTLRNIEATKEFVVNSANEWLVHPLVHCAAAFPYGVDEMHKVGLSPLPSTKVAPPRVKESGAQLECTLHQIVEIGDGSPGSTALVIGKVEVAHIYDSAIKDGRIDSAALKPISRLGGIGYAGLGEVFNIAVPKPF